MNQNLAEKILSMTRKLKDIPDARNKHFSFIIRRSRILSVGWNNCWKTHPIAQKCGYRFDSIHSELSAIIRFQGDESELRNTILINTRINSLNEISFARPCEKCMTWIPKIGFKKVYYSTKKAIFEEMNIPSSNQKISRNLLSVPLFQ